MKVRSARFVKSASRALDFPRDGRGEVAFIGRSNVGKSRLLNALAGVRGLARISRSPGRTQTINFFLVDERFYLVDLPGYGYARVPRKVQSAWHGMVESYLRGRPQLKLVLLLVDARIPPTPDDVRTREWLDYHGVESAVVLTKADKLSRNQMVQSVKRTRDTLCIRNANPSFEDAKPGIEESTEEPVPFSAVSGLGKDAVWRRIRDAVFQVEASPPSGR